MIITDLIKLVETTLKEVLTIGHITIELEGVEYIPATNIVRANNVKVILGRDKES